MYEKLDFERVVQETVNRQLSRATQEVGRINGAVDTAKQAGVEADALTPEITDLEAKIDALEVVERMTSTAGVPQLMIDQALIQLQMAQTTVTGVLRLLRNAIRDRPRDAYRGHPDPCGGYCQFRRSRRRCVHGGRPSGA